MANGRRGGRRSGTPGTAYTNRTDLQRPAPVVAIPGQGYGAQAAQVAAQRQVPSGPPPAAAPSSPTPQQAPGPAAPGSFARPSERPGEPVTHGLPVGAGGGPEALMPMTAPPAPGPTSDPGVEALRAIWRQHANEPWAESIRRLLEESDR